MIFKQWRPAAVRNIKLQKFAVLEGSNIDG